MYKKSSPVSSLCLGTLFCTQLKIFLQAK
jgi:hypothetical protein